MKIFFKYLFLLICILRCPQMFAQVAINTTGAAANTNAMLDVSSNNKGILIPRMTSANRNAISNPKTGLLVFDSTTASFWYAQTHVWRELSTGSTSSDSLLTYGQTSGTVSSYNISNNAVYTTLSGYLYDTGGPAGNYSPNENITATIAPAGSGYVGLRLQILYTDFDFTDAVYISDAVNTYRYSLTSSGVLYLPPGSITIQFISDNIATYTGFQLRWDVIKAPATAVSNPPLTGWYYNPQEFSEAGGVNIDNYWSPDSTGMYSLSYGGANKASGKYAVSLGNYNAATGDVSTALGYFNIANGLYSAAVNYSNTAAGEGAFASGIGTQASGIAAFSTNDGSRALGYGTAAFNESTTASGEASSAFGLSTIAKGFAGTVLGMFNDSILTVNQGSSTSTTPLLIVGNGNSNTTRSNAMVVLKNGNTGMGTNAPSQRLEVNGNAAITGNITEGAANYGIIRNSSTAQMKLVNTSFAVNPAGGITAGSTINIPVTFSEAFSSPPLVYIGNCNGSGGWAEAVMTTQNVTTTGCTLWIFNPRGITVNPNYTVNIIAIGTP